jgi:predicted nucleic acid-binding protein
MLTDDQVNDHVVFLRTYCNVCPITVHTVDTALAVKKKYHFQWYDCTILSAALIENCTVIYCEDMQHNQLIEGALRIVNPFL